MTPDQFADGRLPGDFGTAGRDADGRDADGRQADGAARLARFKACESAEDYFAVLEVPYDSRVVAVNRLHILRHFAQQIVDLHRRRATAQDPETVLSDYRDALARSYQAFTTSTALDHRLFKVLRDRAPGAASAPGAFVPVTAVSLQRERR